MCSEFLLRVMRCSKMDCGDGCTSLNMLKAFELYDM